MRLLLTRGECWWPWRLEPSPRRGCHTARNEDRTDVMSASGSLVTAVPRRLSPGPVTRQPPLFRVAVRGLMSWPTLLDVPGVEPEQDDTDPGGNHQRPH